MKWMLAVIALAACGPHRAATATDSDSPHRADCKLAPAGCHSAEDCHGRGICESAVPTGDPGCGIPLRQVDSCKADADCKSNEACNRFVNGCEGGQRCEPRCESAGCPDGSACRADGRCSALRCPDEWSCSDYGDCVPAKPGEGPLQGGRDWHGCVPASCRTDADCPCAHCVSGRCGLVPGHCFEARG